MEIDDDNDDVMICYIIKKFEITKFVHFSVAKRERVP